VRLAHELQRAGDLPEAERHVRLALEALAGGSPHPGLVADVRRQEGVSAFRRGEWSTAYDRWMEALHGYARAGNTLGRARVCNNIAAVHLHEGRYDQAREAFTHAQELAERCGATHTALRAHHNLGALHEAEGELDAAIAHYARCAMWAREADLKEDHWRALIGTAVCLLEKQPVDHGRVEELLDEALRLTEECHDERARAQVLRNRAYAQERAARYDEAVADYQACLDVFARLGERHWQASALGRLGLALCAAGSTVSGRAHVADALDRLSDLGDDTRVAAYRAELAGLLARGLGDAPASGGN
jgi:tetratricopeptide (TPR) repeat protein